MSRMGAYQLARAELDAAEIACVTGSECELERLEKAASAFEAAGGYAIDAKVARVLAGLGFETEEFDQRCDTFSGGWQMRIGCARRAATPLGRLPGCHRPTADVGTSVSVRGQAC
eukprot:scaffold6653_cov115-Isochrysis_galbana.AAC.1